MTTIRETVLDWDPETQPTKEQYDAAKLWMNLSSNKPSVGASDFAKIKELIRRYEYNHPEIFPRPDGGIGRRAGFKIQCPEGCEGSTPS